jgi:hypothetical protein
MADVIRQGILAPHAVDMKKYFKAADRETSRLDLKPGGDNHLSRLAHQPIHGHKRLVISGAGKKEGGRQVIKLPAFILAQFGLKVAKAEGEIA